MATYNGAIKVRPCTVINIPQPGVVQELDLGLTGVYNNAGPQPIITSLPSATTQLLINDLYNPCSALCLFCSEGLETFKTFSSILILKSESKF
jgi:hypothetical protein